jgi:hypothetical protein
MASEVNQLRNRIESFQHDEPGPALPFASRQAREQGWDHSFAGRVVGEYLRFILLAMDAGHSVMPSGQVDQAWHLHSIYTRNYWENLLEFGAHWNGCPRRYSSLCRDASRAGTNARSRGGRFERGLWKRLRLRRW